MNTEVWLKINLRDVSEYCEISNFGNFRYNIFNDTSNEKPYISSNGLYYQIIVFNDLKKIYPNTSITKYNIGTIKSNMRSSYHFPNMKLNKKISENDRLLLVELLKNYDMSPSKAFKHIDEVDVENVTIYDLKYIKRRLTC